MTKKRKASTTVSKKSAAIMDEAMIIYAKALKRLAKR